MPTTLTIIRIRICEDARLVNKSLSVCFGANQMIGSVAIHAPRPLSLSRSPRRGPCGSGQVVKVRSAVSGGGAGSDQGRFGMMMAPGASAAHDNGTDWAGSAAIEHAKPPGGFAERCFRVPILSPVQLTRRSTRRSQASLDPMDDSALSRGASALRSIKTTAWHATCSAPGTEPFREGKHQMDVRKRFGTLHHQPRAQCQRPARSRGNSG